MRVQTSSASAAAAAMRSISHADLTARWAHERRTDVDEARARELALVAAKVGDRQHVELEPDDRGRAAAAARRRARQIRRRLGSSTTVSGDSSRARATVLAQNSIGSPAAGT